MKTKEKTLNRFEKRLDNIERMMAEAGLVSNQPDWVDQMRRDAKIVLVSGIIGLAAGVSICAWLRQKD